MNVKPNLGSTSAQSTFDELVASNVETISRIERAEHQKRTLGDRIADAIAGFCGSQTFLFVHCFWFGGWLIWNGLNLGPKSSRWDPPPFNVLTLVVSLEAIYLSTFILISQNRQQRTADQRNHLDLQINMLAEQESSQMLAMLRKVMEHLEIPLEGDMSKPLELATDAERLVEQIGEVLDIPASSGASDPDKEDSPDHPNV